LLDGFETPNIYGKGMNMDITNICIYRLTNIKLKIGSEPIWHFIRDFQSHDEEHNEQTLYRKLLVIHQKTNES
jgi:hypothetical protein